MTTLKCKRGCDDNIKTDRRKVVCDVVGFNHLTDSVNMVSNIRKHGRQISLLVGYFVSKLSKYVVR